MSSNGTYLLVALSLAVALPGAIFVLKRGGYRLLCILLLMGFSASMLWAFLFGCAYEPVLWVKSTEIVVCALAFILAVYSLIKESRNEGQKRVDTSTNSRSSSSSSSSKEATE